MISLRAMLKRAPARNFATEGTLSFVVVHSYLPCKFHQISTHTAHKTAAAKNGSGGGMMGWGVSVVAIGVAAFLG